MDGSQECLLTPVSYFSIFHFTRRLQRLLAIRYILKVLRLISVLFSICATPLYVAVLNYHYELIPSDLLETLILSRAQVPFPPLIETLFRTRNRFTERSWGKVTDESWSNARYCRRYRNRTSICTSWFNE